MFKIIPIQSFKNLFVGSFMLMILLSCGGGGGGASVSSAEIQPIINISHSILPTNIHSFQQIKLDISSNYIDCNYSLTGSDIHFVTSSDNSFIFNAPITTLDQENFKFRITSIASTDCPSGSKEVSLIVKKSDTKYEVQPLNNINLKTNHYHISDIGFGGIEIQDRYTAIICYPTPNDCTSYVDELFGQDAHNMATGDFNGDGYEDLVVSWAIFPHTIEESQKVYAPIQIYLNNGNGHLYEDLSIYENLEYFVHPFAYRLVIEDFNFDGVDDIFAGSMGKHVRYEDSSQDYIAPYPHLLLLSSVDGKFEDKSENIEYVIDNNNNHCNFAHDASGGDIDGDGDKDIYACNMLYLNNGLGKFSIHPVINYDWHINYMSPMSSLLTDLNNDGYDDILFWNFDNRYNFDLHPEEGTILLSNGTPDISEWKKLNLPKGPFEVNHNKYNHAVSGDIDNDGFNDVVVSITRDDPYYDGAPIQILINDGTGLLIDKTTSNFTNQVRINGHHGESNIYLRDIDNDGDLDIFQSTRDFYSIFSGAHIALNDGKGVFTSNELLLGERPISFSGSTTSLMKGVPINLDNKGCIDLVSTSDSWSTSIESRNYLFLMLNIDC